jgi:steroid delta-isomerase-like uncharacterized protein
MSIEANKQTVRRVPEEIFNAGWVEAIDEVFAPDYLEHALPPGYPTGVAALRRFVEGIRTAFPDLRQEVEDIIAEGDRVAARLVVRGTHTGAWELLPVPPSGRTVEWTETHVVRMQDGRIVEHWENRDELGLLQRLGVPAAAVPAGP